MKEIKCTIIQDILPLYIDEVVSLDTKKMIDGHLNQCEKCKKEYEMLKRELFIPIENKDILIKKVNKKWRQKKAITIVLSVFVTVGILFGLFAYVFYFESLIPYSENLIKIEEKDNIRLISQYYGKSYAGVHATEKVSLEIEGKKETVSIIYYTKTLANSPTNNFFSREKEAENERDEFQIVENEKIDAVYYAEFDLEKIVKGKDSWEAVLKRAERIWEKE